MKLFWGLGKFLTLLFWVVVGVNLFKPLINPLHLLVSLAGCLLLLTHVLELLMFNRSLSARAHPWRDRLLILFLGVFYLYQIPASAAPVPEEANHA